MYMAHDQWTFRPDYAFDYPIRPPAEIVRIAIFARMTNARLYDGILRFSHVHHNWRVTPLPACLDDLAALPEPGGVQGVIGTIDTPQLAEAIMERGWPVVSTNLAYDDYPLPCVIPDDEAIGKLAAEYFLGKGYRSLVYLGPLHLPYSTRRAESFANQVEGVTGQRPVIYGESISNFEQRVALATFLRSRPMPVAILAANDAIGSGAMRACLDAGLSVPEQVALLGCGDNSIFCQLYEVSQSSIDMDFERVGYEAARRLADLIADRTLPEPVLTIPPTHIVERRSTDALAVADPALAAALNYLREHIDQAPTLTQLADAAATGTRNLQNKFREQLNRTASQEIQSMRTRRARELLLNSTYNITEISRVMNFHSPSHFSRFFKQHTGQSPAEFRQAGE